MKRSFMAAAAAVSLVCVPDLAHAWTKSYVVEWFEPAFLFGGPEGASEEAPGRDCPEGPNTIDVKKELQRSYRTPERVAYYLNPENGIGPIIGNFGFRGPHAENIYENPTTLPDPGFKEVQSPVALGFDLDDNPNTGFAGPNGEKGIDNNYYKAGGCIQRYRGVERTSTTGKFHMELMRSGGFTVLMVVEGSGADPMNDEDVMVGFFVSQDRVVKDGSGEVANDYSFRRSKDPFFQTVFKANVREGVLQQDAPVPLFRTHESRQTDRDDPYARIYNARIRFDLKPQDKISGLIGGYRTWYDVWRNPVGNGNNGSGAIAERLSSFNSVGFYYALRRNADGLPDAEGRMTGISTAYRYFLRPAFVVDDGSLQQIQIAGMAAR